MKNIRKFIWIPVLLALITVFTVLGTYKKDPQPDNATEIVLNDSQTNSFDVSKYNSLELVVIGEAVIDDILLDGVYMEFLETYKNNKVNIGRKQIEVRSSGLTLNSEMRIKDGNISFNLYEISTLTIYWNSLLNRDTTIKIILK